ncbi:cinnamoyl-CoA reductase [Aspergillus steynii IBT 23096]|uniref:Cinnamoyl-CoA reductase n=1 Tax=Aspergillus steynii IBT 23096 TaxID=1392250 RepID=A0A2I2GMC9_9EURO|nr:cinnamoyl-CoA reductase [Aspergillus steynii IBT 23096]PLB54020.1 cinnamoyl-CoA reductase [Aspergillus steynii IBT 23096]
MLNSDEYAIPIGSEILVTGANGYIASHVIDILLKMGYMVRGTVRAEKPWLDQYFSEKYGDSVYKSVIIPAFDDVDALREALKDVSGVIHIAMDVTFTSDDPAAVIPWVKRAIGSLLELSAEAKTVKRFVLTSSNSAAHMPTPDVYVRIDENTWNETSAKAMLDESTPPEKKGYHVYATAKTEAERSAWEWVKNNRPEFEFNSVLPDGNYGRILHPEIFGSTMGWLRNVLKGDDGIMRRFPPQWYINVEDTARLHVAALLSPEFKNERIFAFAAPFTWTEIIGILRKLRPDNTLIPDAPENEGRDISEVVLAPRAEQLLKDFFGRPGWVSLEQSILEGLEGME